MHFMQTVRLWSAAVLVIGLASFTTTAAAAVKPDAARASAISSATGSGQSRAGNAIQVAQRARRGRRGVGRGVRRNRGARNRIRNRGARNRARRGRSRARRRNRNRAIGVGAAIIGGLIINEALRNNRGRYNSAIARCEDDYRSFRRSDGTFQPFGGGPRRLCPYLR